MNTLQISPGFRDTLYSQMRDHLGCLKRDLASLNHIPDVLKRAEIDKKVRLQISECEMTMLILQDLK